VRLSGIEVLVLDEADHMFDLGFLPSIKRIVAALPKKRQNMCFSATMPDEIRHLADRILVNPEVVELNHSAPAATIEHALYPVADAKKLDLLEHLLAQEGFTSAIVFLRTKHRAKRLAQRLDKAGHAAVALQGNMSQSQREKAMAGFRSGKYDVLVATDIAARGIDVADVSHVINFDVPGTPDAYTHRIGRTGRAEKNGTACTLVTPEDGELVRAIEKRLGQAIPRVRVEGFGGERRAHEGPAKPAAAQHRAAARASVRVRGRGKPVRTEPAERTRAAARPHAVRRQTEERPHAAARPATEPRLRRAEPESAPAPARSADFGAGVHQGGEKRHSGAAPRDRAREADRGQPPARRRA
jgi:ATP-dependent RNA helicase RhlE